MATAIKVDAYTQATTNVADGLLWRWLPIALACFVQVLQACAQTQAWVVAGSILCLIAIKKSRYWAVWIVCTTLSLVCLTVPSLYTINIESWGLLSTLCLLCIAAAQYLRPPAYRLLELDILRDKLPCPRLMVGSVITPLLVSHALWAVSGASGNIWLIVHAGTAIATLALGVYYAWVYSE